MMKNREVTCQYRLFFLKTLEGILRALHILEYHREIVKINFRLQVPVQRSLNLKCHKLYKFYIFTQVF